MPSPSEDVRRLENVISRLSDQLIRERKRRTAAEDAKHRLVEEIDDQNQTIRELKVEILDLKGLL